MRSIFVWVSLYGSFNASSYHYTSLSYQKRRFFNLLKAVDSILANAAASCHSVLVKEILPQRSNVLSRTVCLDQRTI